MAKRRADGSYKLAMRAGEGRADGTGSLDARARRESAAAMAATGASITLVMAKHPGMSRGAIEAACRDRVRADKAAADIVAGKDPELVLSLIGLPVYTINAALSRLGRADLHLSPTEHRSPSKRARHVGEQR